MPEDQASQEGFTTHVMDGVKGGHDGMKGSPPSRTGTRTPAGKRPNLTLEDYYQGVINRDRTVIARAITLIESNAPHHFETAQELLQKLLPLTGNSIRIGISGVPGAGKSSIIEALGTSLCSADHRVAVLAVDPSSSITKGSILGDKTRMAELARMENSFIRPSPSGGMLGGVARKSRETMLLCEAAGYDVILIETVGVGQNEITVRSMVDFFLLVLITGAGDELQGMKKGVMEICDAIVVNKADGENLIPARSAAAEYTNMLHYLTPATAGWTPRALACSARDRTGIDDIWDLIQEFRRATDSSGVFQERRRLQVLEWVFNMVTEQLTERFYSHDGVRRMIPSLREDLMSDRISPTMAVKKLLEAYDRVRIDRQP